MLSKLKRIPVALLGAFTAVLLIGGFALSNLPAAAQTKQPMKFAMGGDGLHYFLLHVARGAGFFAEEGIDVELVDLNSGTRQAAGIMGGSVELASFGFIQVVKSAVEGGNMVAVSSAFEVIPMEIVLTNDALKKSGIDPKMGIDEKVKRLAGLQIAVSSPGSVTDIVIRNLLLTRGMDPDKSLKLQPLGSGGPMLAAFEKGVIDGFVWASPLPDLVEAKGIGRSVINVFSGEVPELADVPYQVFATSKETLAKNPKLIRGAVRALTKASKLIADDPKRADAAIRKQFPDLEQSLFDKAVVTYRGGASKTPVISQRQLDRTLDWMSTGQPKKVSVKMSDVVFPDYAAEAAKEILNK